MKLKFLTTYILEKLHIPVEHNELYSNTSTPTKALQNPMPILVLPDTHHKQDFATLMPWD